MPSRFTDWVDPFIATNWPGNGLCGPYLPYSLVRLGPDTLPPVDTTGYTANRPIMHFSHTHVSGTGGNGRYGNMGLMPFTGWPRAVVEAQQPADERAHAGYYSVVLQPSGVKVELTSTPRAGIHRYTFPVGSKAHVLIDAGAVVQVGGGAPGAGSGGSIGGFIETISPSEILGRSDFRGGWGHKFPYSVFFFIRFDTPAQQRQLGNHAGLHNGVAADGPNCRAVFSFENAREIVARAGISFVSVAKARASLEREAGRRAFDEIRSHAENIWNRALARIRVEGGSEIQKRLFYTFFSRLLCMPTDLGVDDENPLWQSGVRSYSEFYCLWDSVRNANSFLGLFDPQREAEFLNSLLDVADHLGWVPDAWIAGHSAQIQGGSSADVLFCEAALKGLPGIDLAKALKYMRRNAEEESPDPSLYGRYVKDYRELGYLSTNVPQGCSRHVEYAYQDWCIGALAEKLGQHEVARRYWQESRKAWNLWRADIKSIAPRKPDGSWVELFDPHFLRPDCWADPHFYEGSGLAWSCNVFHDFAGLIQRVGGPEAFIAYVDQFFAPDNKHPWKEIVLHLPYLYTYAGRPDLTAACVRAQLQKHYRPTRDGLDDNEDMGCQSAFFMCASMGVYPIMGQDLYILSTPSFRRSDLDLGGSGKTLTIQAPAAGPERPYVAAVRLNGKPLERPWLRHGEIAGGATLEFELSDKPTAWGTRQAPPSPLASGM